jgi:hypothetical protein
LVKSELGEIFVLERRKISPEDLDLFLVELLCDIRTSR